MERRVILAIVLMVAVMVLSNVLFPPVEVPVEPSTDSITVADDEGRVGPGDGGEATPIAGADSGEETAGQVPDEVEIPESLRQAAAEADTTGAAPSDSAGTGTPAGQPSASDTVVVRSSLYEYRFDTRGARFVGARLLEYLSYAPEDAEDQPVELLREGDAALVYRLSVGPDTVDVSRLVFEPSARRVEVGPDGETVRFTAPLAGTPLRVELEYHFSPDNYRIDVRGRVAGLSQGHSMLVGLGHGLRSNEANAREDFGQMDVVVRTGAGDIEKTNLDDLEPGEIRAVAGGPFTWAAAKSKYFLLAFVPDSTGPSVGGVLLRGNGDEHAADIQASLPVAAGSDGFAFTVFAGPQTYDRLRAAGRELQNVNPIGWGWLQWLIRPVAAVVMAILVWMHNAFSLAYGWVLVLFGILTRIIFFPIYQIGMRQQLKQMEVQPKVKAIQDKYKDDPQKLQQEMMRVYREEGVNPLGGCLPALLPFPILITLFFVFQNTIEFRGVPFLWIPDLSLKDPLYIVPLLMGLSMLGVNWIGQRGMEMNAQMKMITWVLPVVFTFMFSQFAAGLNLYYASSNIASFPQQIYLARERRAHRAKSPAHKDDAGGTDTQASGRGGKKAGGKGAGGRAAGGKKSRGGSARGGKRARGG